MTFEHQEFELLPQVHLSLDFFSVVGPRYPRVLHLRVQPTAIETSIFILVESLQRQRANCYALFYVILYKGLEYVDFNRGWAGSWDQSPVYTQE